MYHLPEPKKGAVFYEDHKLYATLANNPIVKGHVVIVWKKSARDLHFLSRKDYEYLMDKVDQVRNALLKTLHLKKVYLIYMDEIQQVHWHLIPRYNLKGFNLLKHQPAQLKDVSLAKKIKEKL